MPHRAASEGSPAPPAVGAAGARLEPLLPTGKKPGRPPTWSKRQLINEIRWWTRTGRHGGTCPPAIGRGRPCMGCFDAGSATAPGSRYHRAWQPGQAGIAAGGGADRRSAKNAAGPLNQ
jgi:hypothetical protein